MIHSRDNWSARGGLARLVGLLAVAAASVLAPHCAGMDPAAPVAVVAHAGSVSSAMVSATEPQQGAFPAAGSPVQGARLAPVEAASAMIEPPHHGATGGLNVLLGMCASLLLAVLLVAFAIRPGVPRWRQTVAVKRGLTGRRAAWTPPVALAELGISRT